MKIAVFWGGPCDGKAMVLSEDRHPYILIPILDMQPSAMFAVESIESVMKLPRHKVARYEIALIHGLPKSKLDIYTFGGYQ